MIFKSKLASISIALLTMMASMSTNIYGENIAVRDIEWVELNSVFPTQLRYSSKNVEEKYQKAIKSGVFFDNGQSLFGPADAVPVISYNAKLFLIDGHHSILASKLGGFKKVPVRVIEYYNGNDSDFWSWMEQQNYAYLQLADGSKSKAPDSFSDLIDDPLRYFVAISARKFEKSLDITASTGAEYPLWVKIYKGTPFVEFKIAEILYALGFKYSYGDDINAKIEEARKIIVNNIDKFPIIAAFPFIFKSSFYKDSTELNVYLAAKIN